MWYFRFRLVESWLLTGALLFFDGGLLYDDKDGRRRPGSEVGGGGRITAPIGGGITTLTTYPEIRSFHRDAGGGI